MTVVMSQNNQLQNVQSKNVIDSSQMTKQDLQQHASTMIHTEPNQTHTNAADQSMMKQNDVVNSENDNAKMNQNASRMVQNESSQTQVSDKQATNENLSNGTHKDQEVAKDVKAINHAVNHQPSMMQGSNPNQITSTNNNPNTGVNPSVGSTQIVNNSQPNSVSQPCAHTDQLTIHEGLNTNQNDYQAGQTVHVSANLVSNESNDTCGFYHLNVFDPTSEMTTVCTGSWYLNGNGGTQQLDLDWTPSKAGNYILDLQLFGGNGALIQDGTTAVQVGKNNDTTYHQLDNQQVYQVGYDSILNNSNLKDNHNQVSVSDSNGNALNNVNITTKSDSNMDVLNITNNGSALSNVNVVYYPSQSANISHIYVASSDSYYESKRLEVPFNEYTDKNGKKYVMFKLPSLDKNDLVYMMSSNLSNNIETPTDCGSNDANVQLTVGDGSNIVNQLMYPIINQMQPTNTNIVGNGTAGGKIYRVAQQSYVPNDSQMDLYLSWDTTAKNNAGGWAKVTLQSGNDTITFQAVPLSNNFTKIIITHNGKISTFESMFGLEQSTGDPVQASSGSVGDYLPLEVYSSQNRVSFWINDTLGRPTEVYTVKRNPNVIDQTLTVDVNGIYAGLSGEDFDDNNENYNMNILTPKSQWQKMGVASETDITTPEPTVQYIPHTHQVSIVYTNSNGTVVGKSVNAASDNVYDSSTIDTMINHNVPNGYKVVSRSDNHQTFDGVGTKDLYTVKVASLTKSAPSSTANDSSEGNSDEDKPVQRPDGTTVSNPDDQTTSATEPAMPSHPASVSNVDHETDETENQTISQTMHDKETQKYANQKPGTPVDVMPNVVKGDTNAIGNEVTSENHDQPGSTSSTLDGDLQNSSDQGVKQDANNCKDVQTTSWNDGSNRGTTNGTRGTVDVKADNVKDQHDTSLNHGDSNETSMKVGNLTKDSQDIANNATKQNNDESNNANNESSSTMSGHQSQNNDASMNQNGSSTHQTLPQTGETKSNSLAIGLGLIAALVACDEIKKQHD